MPELPEVEVTRLGLVDRIVGAQVQGVRLGLPLRWPLGCSPQSLIGASIVDVRRRGKYLLFILGERGVLLLHLGMSGSLYFGPRRTALSAALGRHDHFELTTSRGVLCLNDPRRFGAVVWVDSLDSAPARKLLGKLGAEPLTPQFDATLFHAGLKRRHAPIKQVLLAGQLVVGVGNIYASEALFLAGIRPNTRASDLSKPRASQLHLAVRQVLRSAIEHGGSTLRDFSNSEGQTGYFQLQAMVYGRAGEPCRRCASLIKGIRQGQRSSFFCPNCQKR